MENGCSIILIPGIHREVHVGFVVTLPETDSNWYCAVSVCYGSVDTSHA